jgi:hypothetical protein
MRFIKIIIAIFFLLMSAASFGQADSVKINYSEESIDTSDYNVKRKYKYIDLNLNNEKQLFKISTQVPFHHGLSMYFTYERKIIPALSIIGDFRIGSTFGFFEDDLHHFSFTNGINIGTRYYYNLNKRIKNKLGGNNFHANYFTFKIMNIYSINYNESYSDGVIYYYPYDRLSFKPSFSLGWGIQRKLSKNTIIDLEFLFFSYNPYYKNVINLYENIYIGFAFGK